MKKQKTTVQGRDGMQNIIPVCFRCHSCGIEHELSNVWSMSAEPDLESVELAQLIDRLIETIAAMVRSRLIETPQELGIALASIFDLCISLKYAQTVTDTGWIYCPPSDDVKEPLIVRPYLKACPRCAMRGRKVVLTDSRNKPGSDKIGDISSSVIALMLQILGKHTQNGWYVRRAKRPVSDIDVVLYNDSIVALGEIKASPLFPLPLALPLRSEMRAPDEEGNPHSILEHTPVTLPLSTIDQIFLYHPTMQKLFALGKPGEPEFPMRKFRDEYAHQTELLLKFMHEWRKTYEGYERRWSNQGDDRLRWLTCGCGGDVDDSKNAPGLDRTDDIKKGVYQMLKLGEQFAKRCQKKSIKICLLANTHAVRHHQDYLAGLDDLVWTHEDRLEVENTLWRKVRVEDLVNLYDATITFTRSHFRDSALNSAFGLEAVYKALGGDEVG